THARSAGGIDAKEDAVRPVWTCRCRTLERAAIPSLSSRIEEADANAHKLRATLAVTEAAIPMPIFRATLPTPSCEASARRDHNFSKPGTSSTVSLRESRVTT